MNLNVFDIQRCSFVDGPGIRTTVFTKGCNMRCIWCHNPESWSTEKQLAYFQTRCLQCNICKTVCNFHAIKEDLYTDSTRCELCGQCVEHCPTSARRMFGQTVPLNILIETIMSDRLFYETSGGGVTFSGGECMLQLDGLYEALMSLKKEGIHTAIDTAGDVPWSSFEQILHITDLFLYDIKCFDPCLHRKLTGVDNERIIDNYKRLLDKKAHVIVRVPVVPGANDVNDEIEHIADFLIQYAPEKVEFLPYHRLGEGKGLAIGQSAFVGEVPEASRIDELTMRVKKG